MRERNAVIILVALLILIGAFFVYFLAFKSEFNFYKSEINLDGNTISEKLYFRPDKSYRTLYRDFVSAIQPYSSTENYEQQGVEEKITVSSIVCSIGQPYLKVFGKCYQPSGNGLQSANCRSNTEDNEVGCTFGDVYGFQKDENYELLISYKIQTPAIIRMNEKYYLKFVAYSGGRHPFLIIGKNLFVNNPDAIVNKFYFPPQRVEIYIPYSGPIENAVILNENQKDDSWKLLVLYALMSLAPALILFFV